MSVKWDPVYKKERKREGSPKDRQALSYNASITSNYVCKQHCGDKLLPLSISTWGRGTVVTRYRNSIHSGPLTLPGAPSNGTVTVEFFSKFSVETYPWSIAYLGRPVVYARQPTCARGSPVPTQANTCTTMSTYQSTLMEEHLVTSSCGAPKQQQAGMGTAMTWSCSLGLSLGF